MMKLMKKQITIILILVALCAVILVFPLMTIKDSEFGGADGAAELTVSQWSSLFAEKGLAISKFVGDLLGPGLFAVFMGTGRMLYGIFGSKINLRGALIGCSTLGVVCYIATAFVPKATLGRDFALNIVTLVFISSFNIRCL